MSKRTSLFIIAIIVAAVLFGLYWAEISELFENPREMADWLLGFGGWTILITVLVLIVQSLTNIVPLFIVAGANGLIFGAVPGYVISLSGFAAGSTLAFFLARFVARDYLSRLLSGFMPRVNEISRNSGARVIFFARLLPIPPASVLNYLSGLSQVGYPGFILASVLGVTPELLIFTSLGHSIGQAESLLSKVAVVLILLSLLLYSATRLIRRPPGSLKVKD